MTKLKKASSILFCIGIMTACTPKMDFQNNQQVGVFLSHKYLDFDVMGTNPNGGKIIFNTDGTFTMLSSNTGDPTQNYTGTWSLGDCRDCNTDDFEKDIILDFKNTGWVTNGYTLNGVPVTGYGTHQHGYISQNGDDKWNITFAIDDPEASADGSVKKDFERGLLDK